MLGQFKARVRSCAIALYRSRFIQNPNLNASAPLSVESERSRELKYWFFPTRQALLSPQLPSPLGG
ncbi:hypothetical protein CKA32_001124 [Geitlerinema sp. FC II]|nr:hypothetical protein CKA32_001124 [Geitlerinema sp. FC II]